MMLAWMMSSPGRTCARGCTMTARGMAAVRSRLLSAGMEYRVERMARGEQLPRSRTQKREAAAGGAFCLPSRRVSYTSGSDPWEAGRGTCLQAVPFRPDCGHHTCRHWAEVNSQLPDKVHHSLCTGHKCSAKGHYGCSCVKGRCSTVHTRYASEVLQQKVQRICVALHQYGRSVAMPLSILHLSFINLHAARLPRLRRLAA